MEFLRRVLFIYIFVYLSIFFLESEGPGDFTIRGATDGNSEFRIQGATDGHSNFQIQGASDGGAATYNIQGATDGQSVIQGPYDANQANAKSLQYDDPSGTVISDASFALSRYQT